MQFYSELLRQFNDQCGKPEVKQIYCNGYYNVTQVTANFLIPNLESYYYRNQAIIDEVRYSHSESWKKIIAPHF